MVVFQIDSIVSEPRKVTQAVLQVMDMLGLLRAELARILQLKCADIGRLANARQDLEPRSPAWQQARLLLQCYASLYQYLQGDSVQMYNWLRRFEPNLSGIPLLLMVDEERLVEVAAYLDSKAGLENKKYANAGTII